MPCFGFYKFKYTKYLDEIKVFDGLRYPVPCAGCSVLEVRMLINSEVFIYSLNMKRHN